MASRTHNKRTCSETTVNPIWGDLYAHLMSTGFFSLIMNKIFIWTARIMRKVAMSLNLICYPSCTKSCVSYPRRSGLGGKHSHLSPIYLFVGQDLDIKVSAIDVYLVLEEWGRNTVEYKENMISAMCHDSYSKKMQSTLGHSHSSKAVTALAEFLRSVSAWSNFSLEFVKKNLAVSKCQFKWYLQTLQF